MNIVSTKKKYLIALCLGLAACGVQAQPGYPLKPVRVIVPFPAGGVTDIGARVVTERLGQLLGQPFVIENRPGAGTKLGTEVAVKAPKDGYTLYLSNASYAILPVVDPAASYDPEKDLVPVRTIATYGLSIVVNPALPVKSLGEFIDYARKHPGRVNYGSAGAGSGVHFAGEWLRQMTGITMTHIPYRSTSLAVQDVAGGRLDMTMDGAVKPYVDAGKVRLLAVTDTRRDPRFPDTPTVAEAGLPGYEQVSWLGLFAPVGTPAEVVARLSQAVGELVKEDAVRRRLADLGMSPVAGPADDLARRVGSDLRLYRRIAKETGLKFD
ncbi:Bug family tripartite tricarboxylate transporter substrate binding protein [Variovorax terrae]|uniref:Tripartite tricarboxylate transporter substrate binding protein n=1 Tax=Variovorax terrae TaxID=2923278 RepID=A0A9X1VYA6_9BURK|nr:tripartite tricarboxylate transporter substrate binding protein [Variovorax terrae]MCJ0765550.1 tripartite tricarboxylate transporter substrate binding protein [Variovorax terrae]